MSTATRCILVAIGDLRHAPNNELRKAGALARSSGAAIELFHAIMEPDPGRSFPETATAQTVARTRVAIATRKQQRLQRIAHDPALRGINVTCTATWDYPPHEAIVRRARAIKADLVVAATHRHRFGARLVLTNTDWELIRHCPVPVLLVKSRRPYKNPVVLAAVDPFHAHARPADLDTRLVNTGAALAKQLRGKLHVVHAFMPLPSPEPMAGSPPVMLPPDAEEAYETLLTSTVRRLAAAAGVSPKACHVCMGTVAEELEATARRTRSAIVVMGVVSRSVLKRIFIGNAAERVLDALSCDVLVVKPRGFKSGVQPLRAVTVSAAAQYGHKPSRRSSAPRAPREDFRVAI